MSFLLPSLPPLEGDLLLDVFTHSSLDYEGKIHNEEVGDNRRLADLGEKVFDLAVTQRLFYKKPLLTANEIIERREHFKSDESIDIWVAAYQLKKNLKFAPDARATIDTPEVSRFLLYSYIGAAYSQRGLVAIQSWVDHLVFPDENLDAPSTPPRRTSWAYPQPPTRSPPALPPQSPQNGGLHCNMTPLAIFNQTVQQNGYSVEWPAESQGPAHSLMWTVRCVVSGVERGLGTGRSQKLAKEEAAKVASVNMGWNLLT